MYVNYTVSVLVIYVVCIWLYAHNHEVYVYLSEVLEDAVSQVVWAT